MYVVELLEQQDLQQKMNGFLVLTKLDNLVKLLHQNYI